MSPPLLDVRGLTTRLDNGKAPVTIVGSMTFRLLPGETLAVVGESGSGKSMTALSILRLLPDGLRVSDGQVLFEGQDLATLSEPAMQKLRGDAISMIFQEPMSSLNPVMRIGRQIAEVIEQHDAQRPAASVRARTLELLQQVRLPDPERILQAYPHNLSGGQRQRVMIAMAIACEPRLLIADEPTTALDATVQADILSLLRDLQTRLGLAILLITHNLGVVAENADRVLVMYAGRKVEEATTKTFLKNARHPYSIALLGALPSPRQRNGDRIPLQEIPGIVPSLAALPPGCAFAARCAHAKEICRAAVPPLVSVSPDHVAACVLAAPDDEVRP